MIIRRSTARVRPGLLDEFRTFIEAGTTQFASFDGFLADAIVVGPDILTYVSWWRDADALAAYAGPGWRTDPVVLQDEDRFLVEPLRLRHVELRPAEQADAPAFAAVWHAAWGDGHRGLVPPELEAVRTREAFGPRAAARVPGTTVAVADVVPDGAGHANGSGGPAAGGVPGLGIVGFVTVEGDEVEQLFVAADQRGSGVAADLLSAGEERIAAAGHREAWLAVVAGNARARRFYERQGWSDGGPLDYQAETAEGLVPVPTRRYVKRLAGGRSGS
ncbi:GNAT family N-acetyltransferase [Promicromonospora sp. NPDC057138]|uniref:GNAT family N-acetyltransferase n=1 Tax=Promicromonospora sp. NPDC057138 TaxID=3346031 RepID=UPI003643A102